MIRPSLCITISASFLALVAALPAHAEKRANIKPADIDAAEFSGKGDLPAGQSALTAKVQILLDRSGVSPGVVDGFRGGMSESALKGFERMHGLPIDGRLDPQIWALLQPYMNEPMTTTYTITDEDAKGLVESIPTDYADKAAMSSMGYTSIAEKLAERFHMDEKFLAQLNPGVDFVPGAAVAVTVPSKPIKTKVARIIVDKATRRVAAYDEAGKMVADYPATIGSSDNPSPHGTHTVEAVAMNPNYTYNPNINFKQGKNDKVLTIPPGPNGPVGNVWIDLSKPTYGLHGTPTPSRLFVNESHGCVRLTNWDARELAGMVIPKKTVVEFLAPGTSIADVTPAVTPTPVPDTPATAAAGTPIAAGKPMAKPARGGLTLPEGPVTTAGSAATATTTAPGTISAEPITPGAHTDPLAQALDNASAGALQPTPAAPMVLPQPATAPTPRAHAPAGR